MGTLKGGRGEGCGGSEAETSYSHCNSHSHWVTEEFNWSKIEKEERALLQCFSVSLCVGVCHAVCSTGVPTLVPL